MAILDTKDIPIEIHPHSETITIQDGESTRDVTIPQLVRPGSLVVSLVQDDEEPSSENKKKSALVHLVPIDNSEFSASGESILSTLTGYPHVDVKKDDEEVTVSVTVVPVVSILEDGLKAAVTLYPSVGDAPELTIEDLLSFLKEAGVVQGIDQRFLKKALSQINQDRQPVFQMVVAHAMQPINGVDAFLRMEVEIGSTPGKVRGDGSIDFRERRMFVSVEEGQLIATKVKETKGIPGKNVMGQLIPQKEGRDIVVRVTEDAVFNEADLTVRATKAGVVTIVKDNTIRVSSKQTISGDIDFATGNIYSKNSVEIGGSVKQDFVVSARGDIMIGGDVQSAIINSHGNLVVKGGVFGSASSINIRGDADINFIENGTVHAGGNVVIRKSSYYSTIIADGNIAGDQKTKIVGGLLICSGSLTAGEIGSATAAVATIAAGTDIKRYQHYQELHKKIVDLTEKTAAWLQRHGQEAQHSNKMLEMEEELAEAKAEIASLNLIPGSPVDSLKEDYTIEDESEILVYGEIYAGTRIRIGNVEKPLTLNQNKKKFKIDKITRMIVVFPY